MLAVSQSGLQELIQSGISAGSGLLGVFVGGWLTGKHQKKERQNARRREQLMEFYAPLRGIRAEIKAKSELRTKVHAAAGSLWSDKFQGVDDPANKKRIDEQTGPKYDKIWDYSDEQLKKEIVPLYRKMLEHFSTHMGLAEESTLGHYQVLVEFVEIWNRFLQNSLPGEVANKLDHSETKLYPLYEDIEANFKRLSHALRG